MTAKNVGLLYIKNKKKEKQHLIEAEKLMRTKMSHMSFLITCFLFCLLIHCITVFLIIFTVVYSVHKQFWLIADVKIIVII